ncbi:MAG: MarR family transcriptional regulator [Anaerovoracaceae bacterium]
MNEIRQQLKEFNTIIKEIESLYSSFAKDSGISESVFWVLYYAAQMGESFTQKSISKEWKLSKQTVNNAIRSLLSKGYITLTPSKGDQRNKEIQLTPLGQDFVKEFIVPVFEIEEAIFNQMAASHRQNLIKTNSIYLDNLRNLLEHRKEA